ncbi:unnamed protein product, partial [Pylaiella littoralis]
SPASTSERRQRADGQTHDHFAWQGPTRRAEPALRGDVRRRLSSVQHVRQSRVSLVPRRLFACVHTEPNARDDDRRSSRPTLLGCTFCHDGEAHRTVRVRPGCGLERPLDQHPVRRNQHEQLRVLHRELLLDSAGFQWYGACGVLHEGVPRKAYCREDRAMASTG